MKNLIVPSIVIAWILLVIFVIAPSMQPSPADTAAVQFVKAACRSMVAEWEKPSPPCQPAQDGILKLCTISPHKDRGNAPPSLNYMDGETQIKLNCLNY